MRVRLFVTATANGFVAMPGGLAMTVDRRLSVALSAPEGESRDVWVISDANLPPHVSLWRPTIEVAQVQRGAARPAEPGRRQPVLARPLHRARRLDHARAAHLPQPPAGGQRRRARSCAASRIALEILLSQDEGEIPTAVGADRCAS